MPLPFPPYTSKEGKWENYIVGKLDSRQAQTENTICLGMGCLNIEVDAKIF